MKAKFIHILIPLAIMLCGCFGGNRAKPEPIKEPVTIVATAPIATPTGEQIGKTSKDLGKYIDSSVSSASSIHVSATNIRNSAEDITNGRVNSSQAFSMISPKTHEIDTLANAIAKDQESLRLELGKATAEVLKMQAEIDRSHKEVESWKQNYKSDMASMKKSMEDLTAQKNEEIRKVEKERDGIKASYSGSFSILRFFGIAATVAGLCMLYFFADKSKGIRAIVIGMVSVSLGFLLPSMMETISGYGYLIGRIVISAIAVYAIYEISQPLIQKWKMRKTDDNGKEQVR